MNHKLKETNLKNRACYYFDDININDLDLDKIYIHEKSYENILINGVAYKTPYGTNPLGIVFDKVDGYIRKYDKSRYLALLYSNEKNERIFDRIIYLIMLKSIISDVYSHRYTKTNINSDDNLP